MSSSVDKRTPLDNIFEMVESSGNSRQVLTDATLDATALQTVYGGPHKRGHLSTPTLIMSREIVLGALLEIAARAIATIIGRIHETTTTHVVAVEVATEIHVVNTVAIEAATATVTVDVMQAETTVDTTRMRTVATTTMSGFVNAQDEMTRVVREVHVATWMTRVIYDLVQRIIVETMIKLAVAVDQGHRQPTVDNMTPTLCLSTLCNMGSQTDRQQRTRRPQVRKTDRPRRCRTTSALQRTHGPRVANVLKLLDKKV